MILMQTYYGISLVMMQNYTGPNNERDLRAAGSSFLEAFPETNLGLERTVT